MKNINGRLYSLREIYRLLVIAGKYSGIELDMRVLLLCVRAFNDDVGHFLKKNPKNDGIDPHKKAAYIIKWITKLRPIQLNQAEPETATYKLLINELYAVHAGLSFMKIEIGNLPNEYLRKMLLNFRQYPVVAETFSSEMYLLERCVQDSLT